MKNLLTFFIFTLASISLLGQQQCNFWSNQNELDPNCRGIFYNIENWIPKNTNNLFDGEIKTLSVMTI